jgi:hypothetical protein
MTAAAKEMARNSRRKPWLPEDGGLIVIACFMASQFPGTNSKVGKTITKIQMERKITIN